MKHIKVLECECRLGLLLSPPVIVDDRNIKINFFLFFNSSMAGGENFSPCLLYSETSVSSFALRVVWFKVLVF